MYFDAENVPNMPIRTPVIPGTPAGSHLLYSFEQDCQAAERQPVFQHARVRKKVLWRSGDNAAVLHRP
jgi:hypothetical protein